MRAMRALAEIINGNEALRVFKPLGAAAFAIRNWAQGKHFGCAMACANEVDLSSICCKHEEFGV
jgi:hypothetical protein